ncbi:unnamed protein product [Boreogadus saida]
MKLDGRHVNGTEKLDPEILLWCRRTTMCALLLVCLSNASLPFFQFLNPKEMKKPHLLHLYILNPLFLSFFV